MRLRGRLNQIERKIKAIKEERESIILVATGVWFADEQCDIIPDSGPVTRVHGKQNKAFAFGILLVPRHIEKENWPEVVKRCSEYQETLQNR